MDINSSSDLNSSKTNKPGISEEVGPIMSKPKKKFPLLLVGVLLITTCFICLGAFIAIFTSPQILRDVIFSSQSNPEEVQSTRLSESEIITLSEGLETKLKELENSPETQVTVVVTEEELLATFLKNTKISSEANIGIQIKEGYANLVIPFDDIIREINNSPEFQNERSVDIASFASLLSGINLQVTLTPSTNGKSLVIDDIKTGNSLIDSMINTDIKNRLNKDSFGSMEEIMIGSSYRINNIVFRNGEAVIDLEKIQ